MVTAFEMDNHNATAEYESEDDYTVQVMGSPIPRQPDAQSRYTISDLVLASDAVSIANTAHSQSRHKSASCRKKKSKKKLSKEANGRKSPKREHNMPNILIEH